MFVIIETIETMIFARTFDDEFANALFNFKRDFIAKYDS